MLDSISLGLAKCIWQSFIQINVFESLINFPWGELTVEP